MKIAIAAMGPDPEAQVSYQFGRAPYFIFYDTSTDTMESVPNPYAMAPGGAGSMASQMVVSHGARLVVMGAFPGPNASMVLSAANVEVITGFTGTVKDAIEAAKAGNLRPSAIPQGQFGTPAIGPGEIYGDLKFSSREEEIKYIEERIGEIERRLKQIEEILR